MSDEKPKKEAPKKRRSRGTSNKERIKHKKFVNEFLKTGMQAESARAAGYSPNGAGAQAKRILKRPEIQEELGQRLRNQNITTDRILAELGAIAFSNMSDYLSPTEDGQAIVNLKDLTLEEWAAVAEYTVDETGGGAGDGVREAVSRIRFKLHDKLKAVELLAKIRKMLTDKVEITGEDGAPLEVTVKFVHGTTSD